MDVSRALEVAVSYLVGAVVYVLVMLPGALLCVGMALVSLPLDLVVAVLSGGATGFLISGAFMRASGRAYSWYSDTLLRVCRHCGKRMHPGDREDRCPALKG